MFAVVTPTDQVSEHASLAEAEAANSAFAGPSRVLCLSTGAWMTAEKVLLTADTVVERLRARGIDVHLQAAPSLSEESAAAITTIVGAAYERMVDAGDPTVTCEGSQPAADGHQAVTDGEWEVVLVASDGQRVVRLIERTMCPLEAVIINRRLRAIEGLRTRVRKVGTTNHWLTDGSKPGTIRESKEENPW
jgi:hypothetical protein